MPHDWITLTSDPISAADVALFATDSRAGGIAIFLGVTRCEDSDAGHPLVALDYEAYPEMAREQLTKLALNARDRWPILKLAILHRTGRVAVGEASVAIAVSTPHRAEAFDACRFLIDALKAQAAIWKKEIWRDGAGTWVGE